MQQVAQMPSLIAHRIVGWHPIILTSVLLAGFATQLSVLSLPLSPLARGALLLTPLSPMCVWLWAVFHVSRIISAKPVSGRWEWVFVLPPMIAFVTGVADWSTSNSLAAFAVFLTLFIGLYWAAKTLEDVDAVNGKPAVGRVVATAILMYLVPFGVWILRSKIIRVAGRSERKLIAA